MKGAFNLKSNLHSALSVGDVKINNDASRFICHLVGQLQRSV